MLVSKFIRSNVGLAVALMACLIYLLGCATDGADTSSTSAQGPFVVTKSLFIKRAKAICASANEERNEDSLAFMERREKATGEPLGLAGSFEVVRLVVAPSLRSEIKRLEGIGLPKGAVYEAEALWQTLRTVLHEVEAEGLYAWRSAKLLPAFRNRAKQFGLQACVIN
jgi:hypothetical protein